MFILGEGVVAHPHVCTPPVHLYTPHMFVCLCTFVCPLGVYTHPQGPPMLLCSCMVLAHCMLWGGCFSVLCVLGHTTPIWGCLPLYYTPHTLLLVLCALLFSGISVLMWAFPLLLKGLGVFPPSLGEVGVTHQQLFTCSFCYTFFCSALCLASQPRLRLLLLQLQWYLLACHQCHQYQWLLL